MSVRACACECGRVKRRLLWRGLAAAVGLCAVAAASAASGAPDPTYPNIPDIEGQLAGSLTDTIGYVPPARQWIAVPRVMMAVDVDTLANNGVANPTCVRWFSTAQCTPPPGSDWRIAVRARAYPGDPATPITASHFDAFPAATVRMVAFGSIPVQATVHMTLPLDGDGLPQPMLATGIDDRYPPGVGPKAAEMPGQYEIISDSTVSGKLQLRLSDVTVDGVPVDVGPHCETSAPASLTAAGKGYVLSGDASNALPPAGKYNPRTGGIMNGTLNVPKFAGCGTGGDDLDALMSAMSSGPGFPVKVSQGLVAPCWASPPSRIDLAQCTPPASLSFPARDGS